jgi:molybdopterin converting factor subunit 1
MQIRLLFFAQLRDLAKTTEVVMDVPDNINIADLKPIIADRFPGMRAHLDTVTYAIGNEYVAATSALSANDTVALIPPISGG